MANEKGRNKSKKERRRIDRLRRLLGIDLCACGGGHKLQCDGVCRLAHTNPRTQRIECGALYQIDPTLVRPGGPKKPKRTWKYGKQKDADNTQSDKDKRREKWERNRS